MPKPQNIDYTALSYVALKQMKVAGTTRNIGDAVPEAAHWRNLSNYLSAGFLAVVGGPTAHPGTRRGKQAFTSVTKPEGGKSYTHYRPVDHTGTPAQVPSDAS